MVKMLDFVYQPRSYLRESLVVSGRVLSISCHAPETSRLTCGHVGAVVTRGCVMLKDLIAYKWMCSQLY